MPIIAKSNGEDFELAPTGVQHAVCAFVEDIGTQVGSYMGHETQRHQIVICFELAETMTKGENNGKPFMVSNFYTLSLNEKANLAHDLEGWFGRTLTEEQRKQGIDLEKLRGCNCMLTLVEEKKKNGDPVIRIQSISPLMKGLKNLAVKNAVPPQWIADRRAMSVEAKEDMNDNGGIGNPVADGKNAPRTPFD
jgi:hypothetical protein